MDNKELDRYLSDTKRELFDHINEIERILSGIPYEISDTRWYDPQDLYSDFAKIAVELSAAANVANLASAKFGKEYGRGYR